MKQTKTKVEELEPGDWVNVEYGFSRKDFYVLENHKESRKVTIGAPNWLVSSSEVEPYDAPLWNDLLFLGSSRRRWWWRILPIRDLFSPFPRPQQHWWS